MWRLCSGTSRSVRAFRSSSFLRSLSNNAESGSVKGSADLEALTQSVSGGESASWRNVLGGIMLGAFITAGITSLVLETPVITNLRGDELRRNLEAKRKSIPVVSIEEVHEKQVIKEESAIVQDDKGEENVVDHDDKVVNLVEKTDAEEKISEEMELPLVIESPVFDIQDFENLFLLIEQPKNSSNIESTKFVEKEEDVENNSHSEILDDQDEESKRYREIDAKISELHQKYENLLKQREEIWEIRLKEALFEQQQELLGLYGNEQKQRRQTVDDLTRQLSAYEEILSWRSNTGSFASKVGILSAVLVRMENRLSDGKSFRPAWNLAKSLSNDVYSDLIPIALNMIPKKAIDNGVPTREKLIYRFDAVEAAANEASLIQDSNSLLERIVDGLFSKLLAKEHSLTTGNSDHDRISRAGYHLERNNLLSAIRELEQLTELPKAICQDWIEDAKVLLMAEQAVKIIRSEITCQSVAADLEIRT